MKVRSLPEDMGAMYPEPHDHRRYGHGHHLRVEQSKAVAQWLASWGSIGSVADLSCGNAEIALAAAPSGAVMWLGDFAPGYAYTGPIEQTIKQIEPVDLFICCETLEHLEKPGWVLSRIRDKARYLLLSTPFDNFGDTNAEHLWEWDRRGVEDLIESHGWRILHFSESNTRPIDGIYRYGIWALEAA